MDLSTFLKSSIVKRIDKIMESQLNLGNLHWSESVRVFAKVIIFMHCCFCYVVGTITSL